MEFFLCYIIHCSFRKESKMDGKNEQEQLLPLVRLIQNEGFVPEIFFETKVCLTRSELPPRAFENMGIGFLGNLRPRA
jgi:hypothetical protein